MRWMPSVFTSWLTSAETLCADAAEWLRMNAGRAERRISATPQVQAAFPDAAGSQVPDAVDGRREGAPLRPLLGAPSSPYRASRPTPVDASWLGTLGEERLFGREVVDVGAVVWRPASASWWLKSACRSRGEGPLLRARSRRVQRRPPGGQGVRRAESGALQAKNSGARPVECPEQWGRLSSWNRPREGGRPPREARKRRLAARGVGRPGSVDRRRRPRRDKTALVLGGGGFTGGVYEIGALRALDLLAVNSTVNNFDVYIGTSAGSFIAALAANGVTPEEMMRVVTRQGKAAVQRHRHRRPAAPEPARVRAQGRADAAARGLARAPGGRPARAASR